MPFNHLSVVYDKKLLNHNACGCKFPSNYLSFLLESVFTLWSPPVLFSLCKYLFSATTVRTSCVKGLIRVRWVQLSLVKKYFSFFLTSISLGLYSLIRCSNRTSFKIFIIVIDTPTALFLFEVIRLSVFWNIAIILEIVRSSILIFIMINTEDACVV